MKKLFAGYTQYQLLIFLLLKQQDDEIIFLLPKYLEELKRRLEPKYKVMIAEKEKPSLKKIFKYLAYYKYIEKLVKELKVSEDTILYGDSIVNYVISNKNILCKLEDGTGNYITKVFDQNSSLKKIIYFFIEKIIYFIFFNKILLSEKEKIKRRVDKYYITEIAPKVVWFEDKAIRISLKDLWKKKQFEEQIEILKIFNIKTEFFNKIKKRKIILFTQPLSEEKVISEKEKVELYIKIISKYKEEEIIIKPHPREKTEYSKYFRAAIIIEEKFPAELLYLIGVELDKVVTIFSTAAFIFGKDIKIDFYGTEIHKKLFQTYGSCDSLMKRNAFL